MEAVGGLVSGIGCLIALIGWIWLIVIGFKKSALWGIVIILFSWIGGLIFCIMNKKGWLQLLMITIGGILAGFGAVPTVMKILQDASK